MTLKDLADAEIQVQELDPESSKSISDETDALTDDWDAPSNKENPRNWSACKRLATCSKVAQAKLTRP